MATGIKKGTVDLDDYFDPYVEGAKPAATGYKVGSTDLNQRYAPLAYGTQAAATGMKITGGADLNTLWAKKGTASYSKAKDFGFAGKYTAYSRGSHNTESRIELVIRPNRTWAVTVVAASPGGAGGASGTSGTPLSGTWLNSGGAGADYQIRLRDTIQALGDIPLYTHYGPSGWITVSSDIVVQANTGNYVGGNSDANGRLSGTYEIDVRKIGSTEIITSPFRFELDVGVY